MSDLRTTITEYVHGTVFGGAMAAKAVAMALGRPYSTLQNELTNYNNAKLGVETWAAILDITGDLESLEFMAHRLHVAIVDLREMSRAAAGRARGKDALAAGLQAAAEFGEFCGQVRESLADDKVDQNEIARIDKEGWEAIQAILQVMYAAKEQS